MKRKLNKSDVFIGVIFILVACVSWLLYFKTYNQKDTVSIHTFPQTIGEWTATELPISDDDKAILETDNVFVRRYTNPKGREIYLFVVYSQNNRKVSHPPEICYTGSGAVILSNLHDSFEPGEENRKINVNRLTLELGNERQVLFYWFKVGDTFTANYWKQQGLIALKSLLGKPSSSALIRISTSSLKEVDDEAAAKDLKDFGRIIFPGLKKHLP